MLFCDHQIFTKSRRCVLLSAILSSHITKEQNRHEFWAMGRLNLLGGQSNLRGGQISTHFTCNLPPCIWLRNELKM